MLGSPATIRRAVKRTASRGALATAIAIASLPAVPTYAQDGASEIEEVVVVGRKPEKPQPLDITYEWLDDYDNDNYGLVIRLGKDSRWPIRLYLNSDTGFVR